MNRPVMSNGLTWLMAFATGASVANLWYNQPLLSLIGRTFHVGFSAAGSVAMVTQIGYAIGLLAFVPLADLVERRRLIIILLLLTAVVSLLVAVSPNFWWLESASILLGAVTVVPQVIVPVAADLADSHNRGRIVGIIMSGLLIGVLGARTVSGWIGGTMGWQSIYIFGAALMLVLALLVRMTFPITHPVAQKTSYISVLRSIVPLMRDEPELVRASLTGGALFAAFNAFWTTLTFRLGARPYQFDASIIGMFGLLGIAGASMAPLAGRLADRQDPRKLVSFSIALVIGAFLWMAWLNSVLWALILGILALDLGVQSGQISNQSRIYALRADARARLNTVYMGSYFLGGSLGAGLGSWAWSHWHWTGVTVVALGFLVISSLVHIKSLTTHRIRRDLA